MTVGPPTVASGGNLTATWSGIQSPTAHDWFAIVPIGTADTQWVQWWYTNQTLSGGTQTQTLSGFVTAGTYELRLFANDTFTRLSVSNPFTVAAAPPVVTITSPASNTTVSTSTVAVNGTATDAQSSIQSAMCNGAAATVSNGNIDCTVSLSPGRNAIIVQAVDSAGNAASASVLVTFQAPPSSITIVPATLSMAVGDTAGLEALDNAGLPASTPTWSSNNTTVATVDATGLVTAIAAGQATFTATSGSLTAQATVTVYPSGVLAVGTARWAIDPLPNAYTGLVVAVSSVDTTVVASIDVNNNVNPPVAAIRGLTVDGAPTWSLNVPLAVNDHLQQVIGDVDGGVMLLTHIGNQYQYSLVRVDPSSPSGSNWRYSIDGTPTGLAQAPDGTVFLTVTHSYTSTYASDQVIALDGLTGQIKFEVTTPWSSAQFYIFTGCQPTGPLTSLTTGLTVDTNGWANVIVATRAWSACYPPRSDLDVFLYRITTSGAVSVIPLHHYVGTYMDRPAPFVSGRVVPDTDGSVVVGWTPCSVGPTNCDPPVANYVSNAGPGTEHPVAGTPYLVASGHRAYAYAPGVISAFDSVTGAMAWSASLNDAFPTAALENGQVWVSGSNQDVVFGADGSVTTTSPAFFHAGACSPGNCYAVGATKLLGDTQIGVSLVDGRTSAVVSPAAFLDPLAPFASSAGGYGEWRNSAEACGNADKQQLRFEYQFLKTAKVPSCRNFVNALPQDVLSPYYPFGHHLQGGTWLIGDDMTGPF